MRHQHKGFKLGRTSSHRAATLSAMSTALIKHKRITTTHTKARALRLYVEPLINRAKTDTSHSRRQVFRYLQDKEAVTELFTDIASKIGERPGGYTRIIKIGRRAGDAAPMSVIELVDYNDVRPEGASGGSQKRRTRRGSRTKSSATAAAATAAAKVADVVEDVAEKIEDAAETVADKVEDVVDTVSDKVEETVDNVKDAIEDATSDDESDDEKKA